MAVNMAAANVGAAAAAAAAANMAANVSEINDAANTSEYFGRLGEIERYIGLAGRRGNFRTLHEQHVFGRNCFLTEDFGLHLVWQDGMIFIKPLPASCIDERDIQPRTPTREPSAHIPMVHDSEKWFLYSYTRLVVHESDFNIAIELKLLPRHFGEKDGGWERWKICKATIEMSLLQALDPNNLWRLPLPIVPDAALKHGFKNGLTHYTNRFKYGELRLPRLNFAVAVHTLNVNKHFFHSRPRSDLLASAWAKYFFVIFAYSTVILTAMQAVAATGNGVPEWMLLAFRYSSISFIVFVLVSLVVLAIALIIYLLFQFFGWLSNL
jgi:hypothetical protein